MPETPEIETDKLDEKIHEELEHEGGSLLKAIALSFLFVGDPLDCNLLAGVALALIGERRWRLFAKRDP